MQLISVQLERVRKFREPFVLDGLVEGINLIHGPNEAGKSTIQAAIAAVFMERYSSQAPQQDLAPNDQPDARPLVRVTFLHEGTTYELTKEFFRRGGTCVLRSGSTVLSGDEAVMRLVELFRFEAPQARVITESQLGLPGVFWVPQGKSLGAETAMENARSFFVREIGEEIGSARETAADALISRLERIRSEVMSPTGRGGPLAAAKRALEASEIAYAQQKQLRANSEGLRGRLEQLQATLDVLEAQGTERILHDERTAQQQRKEELRRALEDRARVESVLLGLADRIEDTDNRLAQLTQEQAQLAEAQLAITTVEEAIDECQGSLRFHQERRAMLGAKEEAMATKARVRELIRDQQERQEELDSIDEQERQIRATLDQLEALTGEISALQDQLAGLALGEGSEALGELETSVANLRARLQTLSTVVAIEIEETEGLDANGLHINRLYINGEPVSSSQTVMLDEEMLLTVPGVARVSLTPQQSAAMLRQELHDAEKELERRLGALAVENVADLRAREREHRELTLSLQNLTRERMRLEGEGESLAERLATLARRRSLQWTRREVIEAELGELDGADGEDLSIEEGDELAATISFHAAEIDRLEGELHQLQEERLRHGEAIRWLGASVLRQGDEQGIDDLRVLRAELLAKKVASETELGTLEQVIGAETLEEVGERITDLEDRLNQHRRQVQQCREERQGVLGQIRADPFSEEELVAAEVECERARMLVASLEERRDALGVLIDIAEGIVADVQQDLNAPMKERLDAYARQLFSDATVELGEAFAPQQLLRGHRWESVDRLSWGTREQIALLTRLSVADLMAERGVPLFLMLDDAMLNADGVRLMRLKSILSRAAHRYQILLFTCRPELFSDLVGVRSYDLGATQHS
ncbi:AAA family ATPase [Ferrimicrobium sp.]|uniref:AAA family ATPase n=1 Tax=Ferrimicrobium sp. TaxID=2926050 RepID=UPI00260C47E1|nr:AAA family ATPase [Ferrimicrobium sp.]